jgi:hypothetical protein
VLAMPTRAKKKPPAQQMQQDQQQVSSPVALQMQKQPVQQQGMPAKAPGAPPTPPRETAPPSGNEGMVRAMGGPGAVRSTGFLGGVKTIDQGPATQDAFRAAGRRSIAVRPDVVKSEAVQDVEESFGSRRNLEERRNEGERQNEIDRQKQLEAERIAAEEAAREEEARRQQREESVFDDVNKNVSNDTLDQQIRGLIENLISGKGASTESEEALIRQLMEDRIGAGLVEQRARMGRAGFGASGALAAMEGDVRRQAAQGATQETLAVRRQAEQDAINRALEAIGVDVEKRKQAGEELYQQEYLNALKSALGQTPGDVGGDIFGGEFLPGLESKLAEGGWGDETQTASAPKERTVASEADLPADAEPYSPDPETGQPRWRTEDSMGYGTIWTLEQ